MVWYELEIQMLDASLPFSYEIFNRSDENAGVDLHAADAVHVEQTPMFIPFGLTARLLKVEPMPHGTSNDYLKTDSHFFLLQLEKLRTPRLLKKASTNPVNVPAASMSRQWPIA